MGSFSYSKELDATIEQAFDYLSAVDKRKEWQKGLLEIDRVTPLPDEEGTHWRETFLSGGKPKVADMRYTKLSRPTLFLEEVESPVQSGTISMNFREQGKKTLLTIEVSMRWKGFLKLLDPLIDFIFKSSIKKDFEQINNNLVAMHAGN